MTSRRIIGAVTPRRVAAALLIGAFAREIATFLRWLGAIGHGVAEEGSVHGFLLATLGFAIDVAFIYLALHGFGSIVERRRREREVLAVGEAAGGERDPHLPFDEFDSAEAEGPGWRGGGSDGRGANHD